MTKTHEHIEKSLENASVPKPGPSGGGGIAALKSGSNYYVFNIIIVIAIKLNTVNKLIKR